MVRKKLIPVLLIVVIVSVTVYWMAGRWDTYSRILSGLWPLLVGSLVALAALLEMVWWLRFDRWYYQAGPPICREQWQSAGGDEQVRQAIRSALDRGEWVGRESSEGFFIRRRSSWRYGCRVALRLEETRQGTAIRYEVRPLWSVPLWLVALGALYFSKFRVFFYVPVLSWILIPCAVYGVACAVTYHALWARFEAKRMARLKPIRHALAAYGLNVCDKCGYDLFGHGVDSACPECGLKADGP